MQHEHTLHLTRGGQVLAILHPDGQQILSDHQAVEGTFDTTTAFEDIGPLFEREVELMEVDDEAANTEWIDIWDELLELEMFVETPDGT